MLSPAQKNFLGITKKEYMLLRLLEKSPFNTFELALRTRIPRITAMRLLTKLWKRGFIARHKAAREVRWSVVNAKLLRKRLELGLEERGKTAFGKLIPLSDIASVSVYKGASEMLASNQKILVAHAGERIYCIEPNAIWCHVAKVPAREWDHLNKLLMQKKVIAEIVVEEGFDKVLKSNVQDILSESFLALAKDIRVMPKGMLPSPVETIIFRDQVLFLDWEQLIAVEIANASVVKIVRGFFLNLQNSSTSIAKPI